MYNGKNQTEQIKTVFIRFILLKINDQAKAKTTIFFNLNNFIFVDWFSKVKRILHRLKDEFEIKKNVSEIS